jgi:hypothetical protein
MTSSGVQYVSAQGASATFLTAFSQPPKYVRAEKYSRLSSRTMSSGFSERPFRWRSRIASSNVSAVQLRSSELISTLAASSARFHSP